MYYYSSIRGPTNLVAIVQYSSECSVVDAAAGDWSDDLREFIDLQFYAVYMLSSTERCRLDCDKVFVVKNINIIIIIIVISNSTCTKFNN